MQLVRLEPPEAREYWEAFLAGRPDVKVRDPEIHLQEYLDSSPESKETYFEFKQEGRIVGSARLGHWSLTEDPHAITAFSLHPDAREHALEAIRLASEFLRNQGAERVVAGIDASYLPDFQRAGFQETFSRMTMETNLEAHKAAEIHLHHPRGENAGSLATFFIEVYQGHMDQEFGMHLGRPEDWEAYIDALLEECHLPATWLSQDSQGIAGACVVSLGDVPFVSELGVRKDKRRSGLARALTLASMNALYEGGHDRLSLVVTVGNDPAIRLYESLGFKEVGSRLIGAYLML